MHGGGLNTGLYRFCIRLPKYSPNAKCIKYECRRYDLYEELSLTLMKMIYGASIVAAAAAATAALLPSPLLQLPLLSSNFTYYMVYVTQLFWVNEFYHKI